MLQKISSTIGIVRTIKNWRIALLDHAGLLKRPYQCKIRNGLNLNMRSGTDDRHVLFEIFVRDCCGEAEIKPGAIVVDIGANIGCYSLKAAQKASCVFAFEPFPANFSALRDNIALNHADNVEIFPLAVSNKSGTAVMFIPDDDSYLGRISLHPGRGTRTTEGECITLDEIVRRADLDKIDVLKIDCQGAEYEILYGAASETLGRIKQIITECERYDEPPEWSIQALSLYLQNHQFKVRTHGNLLYAWQ